MTMTIRPVSTIEFIGLSETNTIGYLASHGHDTRAIQDYLGHKNIQHTVRYTEMAPHRFENFWTD
jgi:integrase-like protein